MMNDESSDGLFDTTDPCFFWDGSGLHALTHALYALVTGEAELEILDGECACAGI